MRCDIALCDDATQRETLLSLAGLAPGVAWDEAQAAASRSALEKTGIFATVELRETLCEGGVCLEVDLAGLPRIADVVIEPGGALTSEIQRRLFLRSGSVWEGDEETLKRQRGVIEEYFQSTGYFGSKVTIEAKERPDRKSVV